MGTLALLVGLVVIPVVLLALGHRLRRRTSAQRAVYWGGLVGYLVAALAAMWVGMVPAAEWSESDTMRGFLGYWGLIIGPVIGGVAALAFARHKADSSVRGRSKRAR